MVNHQRRLLAEDGEILASDEIHLNTRENPHRSGTRLYKLWAKYRNGMTVKQALDAGIPLVNVRYLEHR